MRLDGLQTLLIVASAVWLAVSPAADAQIFGGRPKKRPPMRKASAMIHRQPPAVVNPNLANVVNTSNSRVLISLSKQRAYLMAGEDVFIETPISSGKRAGMTPTGSFTILEKDPDHRSSIYGDFVDRQGRVVRSGVSLKVDSAPSGTVYRGAPMTWFMRMTWSGVGMHVGILPGYPASHGCIRLPSDIAKMIYDRVKIGTPVTVVQ
jgi:lipoprotein-anchoring transpeptidase ErfK/SrfK